ncbi:hypothetical protein HD806DRAFT_505271 [Xylariaceae sp. AK1471]|nr:hypothetical protein HD806DRAFT_505271 [Xylariaceae sp. AK1471]
MFGGSRRRRPSTTPRTSATANPNATTAAASAFMSAAQHNPNKALSSAAAAAALRARPHTPTNVAEVQTKRTARRSASVSSSGSGPAGVRRPNGHTQLERRGSSASMSERTFRSPSPHRSSTPASHEQQPPVPQIPDSHKNPATNSRKTGVGMQNFRTASQKMGDESHSWYSQPAGDTNNVRRSDTIMRTTKSPPPGPPTIITSQPTRSDSRNSVNFSYPTVFRPQSPSASPTSPSISQWKVSSPRPPASPSNSNNKPSSSSRAQTSQQLVYDPNSRRMVPKAHIEEAVEYQMKQAAEKPSRKREGGLRREGSQLAKGTVARVKGTMVDENKSYRGQPKRERAVIEPLPTADEMPLDEGPTVTTESLDQDEPAQPPESRGSIYQSPPLSTHPAPYEQDNDNQLNHSVQNRPPIIQDKLEEVDEDPEMETRTQPLQSAPEASDAIPTRQILFEGNHSQQPSLKADHHETAQHPRQISIVNRSELPEVPSEQKTPAAENKPVIELAEEIDGVRRSSSNSPARQARFAPGPAEKLAVRHVPLPRSASPIKSALKHSSSIARETSPSDITSDPSGFSAVSPDRGEESAVSRKKSVRVSFDDQGTVIVGESSPAIEADSPVAQSPQAPKRAWFSNIGRSKKKEIALDDDEVMKPRPALPSFGSIRDKKIREPEERPLVRPLEPAYSPGVSSSPELRPQSSSTLNDSETTQEPSLGQSSDHAIGALLVQDQPSRIAANISRFREPLPPVVTSIDGSGYSTDSLQSSDSEEYLDSTLEASASSIIPSTQTTQFTQPDIDDNTPDASCAAETSGIKRGEITHASTMPPQDVPRISVLVPSPMTSEHGIRADGSSTTYFDVPGGFPDYESDVSSDSQLEAAQVRAVENRSSSNATIFEPVATTVQPGQAEALPQTTLETTTPITSLDNITGDDESEGSIYSDAYEDIPDLDSSGFMSLDAIVESSTNEESKSRIHERSESLPTPATTSEPEHDPFLEGPSASRAQLTPSQDANDWEQAKAFWRSLTTERRRQLELEAAEEAGADGDREEVSLPIRRNSSKKKSPEQTQPAIQTTPAQGGAAQAMKEQDPSRVNMIPPRPKADQESPSTSPKQSHMRMSLRGEQTTKAASTQPQTGMRKTMRSNGGAQSVAKASTRQEISTQTSVSTPPVSRRNQAAKSQPQSSAMPKSGSQLTTQAKFSLQRRGSDASDSSFKRNRPTPGGTFAFRKTMRQNSPLQSPQTGAAKGSGRFSLRSLSPAGSTLRRESNTNSATTPPGMMNRTLRSNSESGHERKRSSMHFPLFGRSTKASLAGSQRLSRFENSSDEDEGAPVSFRSRINDSSDEEDNRPSSSREARSLGKVTLHGSATAPSLSRPTAVPELEEDSPELPDSDDDIMPSPLQSPQSRVTNGDFASRPGLSRPNSVAIGTSTLGRPRSGRGGLTPSFTAPDLPTKDKRGSFLGILRRNKRADQAGKIQRSELVDSAARRDTRLERDLGQLKDLRSEQSPSPRLQKRSSTSRSDSGGLQRPTSAGNLFGRNATTGAIDRPSLVDRRSVSLGLKTNDEGYDLENGNTEALDLPRKKKFGALRRMFKLDE